MFDDSIPGPGAQIAMPDGSVETIKRVDLARDTFTTESGEWYSEDVIPAPRPTDLSDLAVMEAWLDAPSWMMKPRLEIEVVHKRCETLNAGCKCPQCYRVYHTEPDGSIRGSYHFRDNDTCRCDRMCCAD